ncbi:MAG: SDR family NAD(P)-dependent oxidoreductase [Caulobacteraceae bacterium]
MTRRLCLVTGASAGIGAAFAEIYARHGYDLALTARRADRLEALAADLRGRYGVTVLVIPADLTMSGAVDAVLGAITAQGRVVDALVNNAGFSLAGSYLASSWADQATLLQVLLQVPAEFAYKVLGGMTERGFGRIVNVASVAGLVPGSAGHTLYGAVKAAMISFSQSLHLETAAKGVHVTAVCPGFTYSEFHDVNGTRDLVSRMPGWMWLSAQQVAEAGYVAAEANRPMSVPGRAYKAITTLAKLLPTGAAMAVMRRQSGRIRRA